MPIQLTEKSGGRVLIVRVTGKLLKADYETFVPEFDRLIAKHGKLRVMFDMKDFHGWDASAAWQDFKFGVNHFTDIERLALVGETQWQHGMATFSKPFTMAKVRYFDRIDAKPANDWLEEGLAVPHPGEAEHSQTVH